MGLQVVGAGLGRTGTLSLKQALEQLLDGPCYHMMEVFGKRDAIDTWHRASKGQSPDWNTFLDGYVATVDWPAAAFWDELAEANPDAVVLLSTRDADAWWTSASNTIFAVRLGDGEPGSDLEAHRAMAEARFANTFTASWPEEEAAKAAFLATTTACAPWCRRTGSWSTTPATAGVPCATRSACPSRPSRTRT